MSNVIKRYYSLNDYFKNKYGKKVYKLSINAGFTCPNRDGTLGTKGCIFCSEGGSGEFATSCNLSIKEQLESAKEKVKAKTKDNLYIAYFQPFTNTYGKVELLEKLYMEAIECEYIVGLAIATRPDCLDDDIIALLSRINKIKPVWIELGLQTIHQDTSKYIRRGYELEVYNEAVNKLHNVNIEVVTHIIIGLPYEDKEMILDTVRYVGKLTDGIKLQLLHIIKNTDLEIDYNNGKFNTLTLEEYTDILCECIEILPKNIVVHRITGDGDKKSLIAPLWSGDKKKTLNYINKTFEKRNVIQGKKT